MRCLVAVAEERSFSRAATRLGTTQSAVSQLLRRLEDVLGHQLIERDRHAVRLTDVGAQVLEQVRRALAAVDSVQEAIGHILRGETGQLRLGLSTLALYGAVPGLVRRFRDAHPAIDVTMTVISSVEQADALRERRLDATFTAAAHPHPDLARIPFAEEALWLAVPRWHRLAGGGPVGLEELAQEPWIMPSVDIPLHGEFRRACLRLGFEPTSVAESSDFSTTFGLVMAGAGVALAAESFRAFAGPDVVLLPLKQQEPRLRLYLSYRLDEDLPVVRTFLEELRRPA